MTRKRKPAITLTIEQPVLDWIDETSEKEHRSISNFMEWLAIQEMKRRGEGEPTSDASEKESS